MAKKSKTYTQDELALKPGDIKPISIESIKKATQIVVNTLLLKHLKALINAAKSNDANLIECVADSAQAFIDSIE